MPAAPARGCTTPGCRNRAAGGRCPACRARRSADSASRRGTAAERGYDASWRTRSRDYLSRHRRCALGDEPATVADHYPTSRRDLVAAGVPDPDADERLRPLCAHHHATETARHQPGGWNRWNIRRNPR